MAKTMKFAFNKVTRLDNNPEALCTTIKCGKYSFTMVDFTHQYGHDDSLPYHAKVCVNDVPLVDCFNDGWGGTTCINTIRGQENLLDDVEKYLAHFKWGYREMEMELTIDFIADVLAETCDILQGN